MAPSPSADPAPSTTEAPPSTSTPSTTTTAPSSTTTSTSIPGATATTGAPPATTTTGAAGGHPVVIVGTAISDHGGPRTQTQTQSLSVQPVGRTLPYTGSAPVVPTLTGVVLVLVGAIASRSQRRRRLTPIPVRSSRRR